MKNNKQGIPQQQHYVSRQMAAPSREVTPQTLVKLNLGPGNNFIVKNSNILITQNTVNKGTMNSLIQNNNDENNLSGANQGISHAQMKSKLNPSHQRTYSFESKQKIYQSKLPQQYNTQAPPPNHQSQTMNNNVGFVQGSSSCKKTL